MLKKHSFWIILTLLIAGVHAQADQSRKAYELIYDDIQLLKQQVQLLDDKIDQNREDILSIKAQIDELITLSRAGQVDQTRVKEGQDEVLSQYRSLLEKFESLNDQLIKMYEDMVAIKRAALPVGDETEETEPEPALEEEVPVPEETEETILPLDPNLSPQEVYNMARSDYLKGNFDLAIEGFTIYGQHFPESPLADNALYWIGECFFSQSQYEEAIKRFNALILKFPTGDKIAAAYLKKGISLTELDKKEEALTVFKLLISKFPLEEETKIAQQKIKELGL